MLRMRKSSRDGGGDGGGELQRGRDGLLGTSAWCEPEPEAVLWWLPMSYGSLESAGAAAGTETVMVRDESSTEANTAKHSTTWAVACMSCNRSVTSGIAPTDAEPTAETESVDGLAKKWLRIEARVGVLSIVIHNTSGHAPW